MRCATRSLPNPVNTLLFTEINMSYLNSSSQHLPQQPSKSATTHTSTPTMRRCRALPLKKRISSPFRFPPPPLYALIARSTAHTCLSSVTIISEAFQSKSQPARHRMVYSLFKDEMAREGGIHALQLRTRTPEEEKKQAEREAHN